MASEKATPKEVQDVLELIGRGEPVPGGFAYNGAYDPPVWKINGRPGPDNLKPPGADPEDEVEEVTVNTEDTETVGGGSGRQPKPKP